MVLEKHEIKRRLKTLKAEGKISESEYNRLYREAGLGGWARRPSRRGAFVGRMLEAYEAGYSSRTAFIQAQQKQEKTTQQIEKAAAPRVKKTQTTKVTKKTQAAKTSDLEPPEVPSPEPAKTPPDLIEPVPGSDVPMTRRSAEVRMRLGTGEQYMTYDTGEVRRLKTNPYAQTARQGGNVEFDYDIAGRPQVSKYTPPPDATVMKDSQGRVIGYRLKPESTLVREDPSIRSVSGPKLKKGDIIERVGKRIKQEGEKQYQRAYKPDVSVEEQYFRRTVGPPLIILGSSMQSYKEKITDPVPWLISAAAAAVTKNPQAGLVMKYAGAALLGQYASSELKYIGEADIPEEKFSRTGEAAGRAAAYATIGAATVLGSQFITKVRAQSRLEANKNLPTARMSKEISDLNKQLPGTKLQVKELQGYKAYTDISQNWGVLKAKGAGKPIFSDPRFIDPSKISQASQYKAIVRSEGMTIGRSKPKNPSVPGQQLVKNTRTVSKRFGTIREFLMSRNQVDKFVNAEGRITKVDKITGSQATYKGSKGKIDYTRVARADDKMVRKLTFFDVRFQPAAPSKASQQDYARLTQNLNQLEFKIGPSAISYEPKLPYMAKQQDLTVGSSSLPQYYTGKLKIIFPDRLDKSISGTAAATSQSLVKSKSGQMQIVKARQAEPEIFIDLTKLNQVTKAQKTKLQDAMKKSALATDEPDLMFKTPDPDLVYPARADDFSRAGRKRGKSKMMQEDVSQFYPPPLERSSEESKSVSLRESAQPFARIKDRSSGAGISSGKQKSLAESPSELDTRFSPDRKIKYPEDLKSLFSSLPGSFIPPEESYPGKASGFRWPKLEFKFQNTESKSKKTKGKGKYKPTLKALLFQEFGTKPTQRLTGIEPRPIPQRQKKK